MTASLEMDVYDFSEGNGMVQVCALLSSAPTGGLECSIMATLALMDGSKAGTLIYHRHYFFNPSFISTSLQYKVKTTLLQTPWRSPSQ